MSDTVLVAPAGLFALLRPGGAWVGAGLGPF